MEEHYVECKRCDYWTDDRRRANICDNCNNSKLARDPQEILCNMCGGCMCPLGTMNESYPHGLHDAIVSGGYDSHHLFDTTNYQFSFCEECLRKLFIQCKIPPTITHYIGSEEEALPNEQIWKNDLERYEYRIWKDNGGHHQAYINKICNVVKDCTNSAVYTKLISDDFSEDCCCEKHKELRAYSNSKLVPFISNVLKPFL